MSDKTETTEELSENELIALRREKLAALRKAGIAFPNTFKRNALASELHASFGTLENEDIETKAKPVKIAGRMMLRRLMGKASFTTIQDMSGKIQLYVRKDAVGDEAYDAFKKWDLGDIIGAEGVAFNTKTGELSLKVTHIELLTKSIRPLPDKFHGLADIEVRYRQRYLDLIANDDSRQTFLIRSQLIQEIRNFLTTRAFLEVETPMMQAIPGGAAARPFETYHNTLEMDLFMRIAPELYLKRLVVGGFERVFEINRNFRNEGVSTQHNPEFTMLEFYQAYADYEDLIQLTEELFRHLAQNVLGTTKVTYQDKTYDLGQPFQRFTVKEAILHYNNEFKADDLEDMKKLTAIAKKLEIHIEKHWGKGKLQIEIFEKTAEHLLFEPTFITQYPTEVSPLARRNVDNPDVTDRFEFFMGGFEVANGFSELNDAEDQAERFKAQVKAKDSGDAEAMFYDEDYVTALEHGLPPTAGEGIGIDRLVMLFTDSASIRDVILFPLMRQKA